MIGSTVTVINSNYHNLLVATVVKVEPGRVLLDMGQASTTASALLRSDGDATISTSDPGGASGDDHASPTSKTWPRDGSRESGRE